jgi:hypothetical protein
MEYITSLGYTIRKINIDGNDNYEAIPNRDWFSDLFICLYYHPLYFLPISYPRGILDIHSIVYSFVV